MTRSEAWLNHTANVLVGGTGVVYAWMRYLAEPTDPYAVVNHPWQPDVQHLHILCAPLLVFACGWIWPRHVWARVRSDFPKQRRSGLCLAGTLVPMIASGYLVQVSTEEAWRIAWIWIHVVTSGIWIAIYVLHQLTRANGGRRAASSGAAPSAADGPVAGRE